MSPVRDIVANIFGISISDGVISNGVRICEICGYIVLVGFRESRICCFCSLW